MFLARKAQSKNVIWFWDCYIWRIPGVYTLHEYFVAQKTYREAGTYAPKIGDIALYLDNRGHTNIVISVDGDSMTTVGGNETGHIRLNTQKFTKGTEGLSDFGETLTNIKNNGH